MMGVRNAVRVTGGDFRECSMHCGAWTRNGYLVRHKTGGTDAVLFMCDECRAKRRRTNPHLEGAIKAVNRVIRGVFVATVIAAAVITGAYLIEEKPGFDPLELRDTAGAAAQVEKVISQAERIINRGGTQG